MQQLLLAGVDMVATDMVRGEGGLGMRIGRGRGISRTSWCGICGRSCEKSLETSSLLKLRVRNFTGNLRCNCTGDAGPSHRWAKRYQQDLIKNSFNLETLMQ